MGMEKKQYLDIQLVKNLMEKLHMDNKLLAEKIGVSTSTVKKLLDGGDQRRMIGDVIVKVARAFGVPPHLIIHKDYC